MGCTKRVSALWWTPPGYSSSKTSKATVLVLGPPPHEGFVDAIDPIGFGAVQAVVADVADVQAGTVGPRAEGEIFPIGGGDAVQDPLAQVGAGWWTR
jgi:hypothetical protein